MREKIRVGIVGLGFMGGIHLLKLSKIKNAVVSAVFDTDRAKYEGIKDRSIVRCSDYKELVNIVDAIIISSPSTTHYFYTKYFLNEGVHCLCEKPPVMRMRELMSLISIAQRNGLVYNVVMPERANRVVVDILSSVAKSGYVFFADRVAPSYDRSLDTSVLFDIMIHDIDILKEAIPSKIKRVSANGLSLVGADADLLNVRIEYENGGFAILNASRMAKDKKRLLRIFYDGGYISADLIKGSYHRIIFEGGRMVVRKKRVSNTKNDPIMVIDRDFIDSILRGKKSKFSADTLIDVMGVCNLIERRTIFVRKSDLLTY